MRLYCDRCGAPAKWVRMSVVDECLIRTNCGCWSSVDTMYNLFKWHPIESPEATALIAEVTAAKLAQH